MSLCADRLREALERDPTFRSVDHLYRSLMEMWRCRFAWEDARRVHAPDPARVAAERCGCHVSTVYRALGRTRPAEE